MNVAEHNTIAMATIKAETLKQELSKCCAMLATKKDGVMVIYDDLTEPEVKQELVSRGWIEKPNGDLIKLNMTRPIEITNDWFTRFKRKVTGV